MFTTTLAPVTAPPALEVKIDGATVAMTVQSLHVDVAIAGLVAETAMQIAFFNPHDRDLEGELTFPLPEGAALAGYALDIEGELVDASLLEKQKARVVFEAEVRKNVDPGLLERVAGNQFRTRIWPLPAKGTRTIKVTWVSALAARDDGAVYELPLRFEPPKRDASKAQPPGFAAWAGFGLPTSGPAPKGEPFQLKVTVAKGGQTPSAESLGFEDRGDAWFAEMNRADGLPDVVRVALPAVPEDVVSVELDEADECTFRIDARAPAVAGGTPEATTPERVALVWDGSFSRATVDKSKEFALLRSVIQRWGSVTVDLLVLRESLSEPRSFPIVVGEVEPLLEALAEVPCDGGTRLAALRLDSGYDACLLFSDGLSTLGDELGASLDLPVYAITSGSTVNAPLLRHLAESSGGAWLDLSREHVDAAAARVGADELTLLGVDAPDGALADLLPAGRRVVEGGAVGISGRLLVDEAEVTLRFGVGTRETARRTVRLARAGAGRTGLVGRLWAQARVDHLALAGDAHTDEILALGRRHGIVTPNTSFLVLETLDQHLEHKVPPAPTRQPMRADYDRHIADQAEERARSRADKLDEVHGWWTTMISWWETEFDPSPPPAKTEKSKRADETDEAEYGSLNAEFGGGQGAPPRVSRMMLEADAAPAQLFSMALDDFSEGMEPECAKDDAGADAFAAPCSSTPMDLAQKEQSQSESTQAGISVKPWNPDTPYLAAMKEAGDEGAYAVYLEQRTTHGGSPSFYFDCATYLIQIGERDLGLRVLSTIADLDLESPQLLRILGYQLETAEELDLAAEVFERVLSLRAEEPQSYRDLALVLDRMGQHRRAAELLWEVVTGTWDDRFPEIETIALLELNRTLQAAKRAGEDLAAELEIEARFLKVLDVDLRVVLAWDADLTDVDLWVTEPTGERCDYSNNLTRAGGRMSRDFTQGYGPEVYTIRRGVKGKYTLQANYYGSGQQTLAGPATMLATVFTNYGRADEKREAITVRVGTVSDEVDVGEVSLG